MYSEINGRLYIYIYVYRNLLSLFSVTHRFLCLGLPMWGSSPLEKTVPPLPGAANCL